MPCPDCTCNCASMLSNRSPSTLKCSRHQLSIYHTQVVRGDDCVHQPPSSCQADCWGIIDRVLDGLFCAALTCFQEANSYSQFAMHLFFNMDCWLLKNHRALSIVRILPYDTSRFHAERCTSSIFSSAAPIAEAKFQALLALQSIGFSSISVMPEQYYSNPSV